VRLTKIHRNDGDYTDSFVILDTPGGVRTRLAGRYNSYVHYSAMLTLVGPDKFAANDIVK